MKPIIMRLCNIVLKGDYSIGLLSNNYGCWNKFVIQGVFEVNSHKPINEIWLLDIYEYFGGSSLWIIYFRRCTALLIDACFLQLSAIKIKRRMVYGNLYMGFVFYLWLLMVFFCMILPSKFIEGLVCVTGFHALVLLKDM